MLPVPARLYPRCVPLAFAAVVSAGAALSSCATYAAAPAAARPPAPASSPAPAASAAARPPAPAAPVIDSIPGTLIRFEMVPVPGTADSAPFHIGRTEVTWDMYDAWLLGTAVRSGVDASAMATADAVARPSEPYGAPDRGWGHAGFPVISVTRAAAESFCAWLSALTGRTYRLPTDAEWQHVADLALATSADAATSPDRAARGDRATSPDPATRADPATSRDTTLDAVAWHAGNADGRTHAVGTRAPDALGLFDLFGNAAEWVITDDGRNTLRGGSYRDDVADIGRAARAVQDASWNERDPQLPKSRWWLSDGPFAGFRIVREP
jgi:formylglycine-generating enzyme required for sulfatase activity